VSDSLEFTGTPFAVRLVGVPQAFHAALKRDLVTEIGCSATAQAQSPCIRWAESPSTSVSDYLAYLDPELPLHCRRASRHRFFFSDGVFETQAGDPGGLIASHVPGKYPIQPFTLGILRAVLHLGGIPLHAAGFRLHGLNVVALGESGAGKSTLAAAAMQVGGGVISDDRMLLWKDSLSGGHILSRSLRGYMMLRKPSLALMSDHSQQFSKRMASGEERWRLDLEPGCGGVFRPDVILLLSESGRRYGSHLFAVSQALVYAAMLRGSSLWFFTHEAANCGGDTSGVLRSIVSAVPVMGLSVGSRLLDSPRGELEGIFRELGHRLDER